jgi:hypothetical protein
MEDIQNKMNWLAYTCRADAKAIKFTEAKNMVHEDHMSKYTWCSLQNLAPQVVTRLLLKHLKWAFSSTRIQFSEIFQKPPFLQSLPVSAR